MYFYLKAASMEIRYLHIFLRAYAVDIGKDQM